MNSSILGIFRLDGRRALVTGASSGLGRRFAVTLARAGAMVFVAARRCDRLNDLVSEIEAFGGTAQAVSLDVRDADGVRQCFDEIAAGGGPVDIIVNNAGVTITKRLLDHNEHDWDDVVDTNLKGSWLVAQESARRLIEARCSGSIINIASILGVGVASGVIAYSISKAGLLQATKSLALELARYEIRVNAILPGYIATDMNRDFLSSRAGERLKTRIPTQRFGTVADLDGPLLLLASAASAHMTGALLAVDGGHLVASL